jgi:hypothetical protein
MKKLKYISAIIIVWMGLFLVGEYHVFQTLESLETAYPYVSFDFGDDWGVIADDIILIAERNNVIAFTYDYKYTSLYILNYDVEIYSTHELPQIVSNTFGGGVRLRSLIRGNIEISFSCINDVVPNPTSGYLFIYGDESNIETFVNELSYLYIRTSPIFITNTNPIYKIILYLFWGIAIIYLLFLTLVDVYFQKKEVFIRVMLGASISNLILKNIFLDIASFLLIAISGSFALSQITSVLKDPFFLIQLLLILIVLNSLIFVILYNFDFKYATGKSKLPKRVLHLSYIIKSTAALFAIIMIASGIMLFQPLIDYHKAFTFFYTNKDYYYANFQFKSPNQGYSELNELLEHRQRTDNMKSSIYIDYFHSSQPIILCKMYIYDEYTNFDIILANIHAYDYIISVVDDFFAERKTEKVYFLIPDSMSAQEKEDAIEWAKMTTNSYKLEYSYLTYGYNAGIDMLCVDPHCTENSFLLIRNPVIIFDAYSPADNTIYISPFSRTIMYRFTDVIVEDIIERFDLYNEIAEITNIYELYVHFLSMIITGFITASFVSIMALILAIITIFRIVSLEYTVNAIELCIKKTLGYSIWQKNFNTIMTLFIFSLICSIIAIIAVVVLAEGSLVPVLVPVGLIFLIDVFAVLWSARRIENARITEILKGGAI